MDLNWVNEDHKISKNFEIQGSDFFMGLGEKTGPINRRGNAYTMWNSDVPFYSLDQDPLYVSIPFYISGDIHSMYGIYVDHSSKSYFNFGAACDFSSIAVEDDHLRYYYIAGESVEEISNKYRHLTGYTPLPPKWSLGFHQSRWSYKSQDEVLNLANEFKRKHLPLDAIHLDIHYMDAWKVFTFDNKQFPNPKNMVESLKNQGVNIITILDPGIKVEKGYPAYENALNQDLFLKYPNGKNYEAGVWPGLCNFPDFTNPKARDWWSNSVKFYTDLGISGLWNDMNEPAAWGKEVPSYIRFHREGHFSNLTQNRNIYGMQMAKATREGAEKLLNKRVFTLTRAGFAGVQRYAAVWTGDNIASDDHMMLSFKMLANMSLCGLDFVGADVGGFMNPATPELMTRWMSIAAFTPFYRAHKMIDMPSSEPWCFGDINTEINRYYISLRYRLMPYLYSAMKNNESPVLKSMGYFVSNENASNCFNEKFESQFVLGNSILVCPVRSNAKSTEVYFPINHSKTNLWYSIHSDQTYKQGTTAFVAAPMSQLPIFVKSGAIIPEIIPPQIENTQSKSDTLLLHVYANNEGYYFGSVYNDDGISLKKEGFTDYYEYQLKGTKESQISHGIKLERIGGMRKSDYTFIQFVVHGLSNQSSPKFMVDKKEVANTMKKSTHFGLKQDLYKVEIITETATPTYYITTPWPSSDKLKLSFTVN
jgi:alpha-glucosidase